MSNDLLSVHYLQRSLRCQVICEKLQQNIYEIALSFFDIVFHPVIVAVHTQIKYVSNFRVGIFPLFLPKVSIACLNVNLLFYGNFIAKLFQIFISILLIPAIIISVLPDSRENMFDFKITRYNCYLFWILISIK